MINNRKCPLLNREIDQGYCYDITMVAYGFIKPEILEDKLNRDEAKKICDICCYNELNR